MESANYYCYFLKKNSYILGCAADKEMKHTGKWKEPGWRENCVLFGF